MLGEAAALGGGGLVEHVAEVLGALVGDLDRIMIGMDHERAGQTGLLERREAFPSGAEIMADPVEGCRTFGLGGRGSPAGYGGGRHRLQRR